MRDNSNCVLFRDGNHIEPPDESYWDTEGTSDNPYVPNPGAQIEGLPVSCSSPSTAWHGRPPRSVSGLTRPRLIGRGSGSPGWSRAD